MDTLEEARTDINAIDKEMAKLFCRRMKAAEKIGRYKKEQGLSVKDSAREQQLIQRNLQYVDNPEWKEYYVEFLEGMMAVSRKYQESLF